MNGPFAIVVGTDDGIVGFTDRIKLRPLVVGENGSKLYISSEEAAIRTLDPEVKNIYTPRQENPS
jgi:glutamate synthase domain-containing protein 1